jgi:hypothetical protein
MSTCSPDRISAAPWPYIWIDDRMSAARHQGVERFDDIRVAVPGTNGRIPFFTRDHTSGGGAGAAERHAADGIPGAEVAAGGVGGSVWRIAPMLKFRLGPPWWAGRLKAPLAQLAEQLTLNQRVRGSSPWRRTEEPKNPGLFSVS